MSKAQEFIEQAKMAGCTPEINGNWIEWTPPLPTHMLVDAINLGNAIWYTVEAECAGKNEQS